MRVIVCDISDEVLERIGFSVNDDDYVITNSGRLRPCVGCFGCWVKNPGVCIIKDGYQNIGYWLSKCDELIVISELVYGCYSPFVLNVWNRSISYLLPYFTLINGETHHVKRYKHSFSIRTHFYGMECSEDERETARGLVHANAINFYAKVKSIDFFNNKEDAVESLSS